jgi:hypothetical protein
LRNNKKENFLSSIPTASIESNTDTLTKKLKFCFDYFDCDQAAGQNFCDWDKKSLEELLDKLKHYSSDSLDYWQNQKVGPQKRNSVFEIYNQFPTKSDFTHPKHIPHQVLWSRFRLESKKRLIGFVIPKSFHGKRHQTTGLEFDCNTFYVVFLDRDHKFYKTK